ncbi:hypothetical protein ACFW5X_22010 [Streptomyces albogriseolus]|uniref:hypothetical protein n=1 Tax=Streptomyces albogriseolus TaxID=1887 RepID=UPI003678CEAC
MQALVPTQTRTAVRALAVVTLLWALAGAPGQAAADACAYASTGPDGTQAVAIAGHIDPALPPCSPPPPPPPTPTPTPTPTPPPPPPPPPPPSPAPTPPPPKPTPTVRPVPPPAARPAPPPPRPVPTAGPRPALRPAPPPPPPAPKPSATPSPRPTLRTVTYPRHRTTEVKRPARSTTSPLVFVLLITTPAVVAVAALRPR